MRKKKKKKKQKEHKFPENYEWISIEFGKLPIKY
jgi:hypothetical protein